MYLYKTDIDIPKGFHSIFKAEISKDVEETNKKGKRIYVDFISDEENSSLEVYLGSLYYDEIFANLIKWIGDNYTVKGELY